MPQQIPTLILSTLTLLPSPAKAQEPPPKTTAPTAPNQVYVKIIMPTDPADRDEDRPGVESWIAEDLTKRGQARFTAVTAWVPLDLAPFEATKVWDGVLGDRGYCPVDADIPDRAEGRINVLLKGWHPGGAYVTISLTDEPGSRAIAPVEQTQTEPALSYVAVLIGPPTAPADD